MSVLKQEKLRQAAQRERAKHELMERYHVGERRLLHISGKQGRLMGMRLDPRLPGQTSLPELLPSRSTLFFLGSTY